jgi:hypothetical protein
MSTLPWLDRLERVNRSWRSGLTCGRTVLVCETQVVGNFTLNFSLSLSLPQVAAPISPGCPEISRRLQNGIHGPAPYSLR